MGRKRRIKKNSSASNKPEPKPVLVALSKRRKRGAELEEINPKRKKTKNQEIEAQVIETSLNDLPPEMFLKILKTVDTKSLFVCRLVNRQWNEISCGILHSRPLAQLQFDFDAVRGFLKHTYSWLISKRSLKDFVQCFKDAKTSPFARFNFCVSGNTSGLVLPLVVFENEDWIEFLTDFGGSNQNESRIKCLKLEIMNHTFYKTTYFFLIEKLRDLLLYKVPHLEEFGLHFGSISFVNNLGIISNESKLFPLPIQSKSKSNQTNPNPNRIKLPQLKIVHVDNDSFSKYPEIIKDLLGAAVNLKEIQSFNYFGPLSPKNFKLLSAMGKLEYLQRAEILLTAQFLAVENLGNSQFSNHVFKLKELTLNTDATYRIAEDPKMLMSATTFLSNLFESIKTSLKELCVGRLGFLSSSQILPSFTNLTDLTFALDFEAVRRHQSNLPGQLFPPGIRSLNIFPAVNRLELDSVDDWKALFPHQDSIPRLPLVATVTLCEDKIEANVISKLALLCPNLKNFQITSDEENYGMYLEDLRPNVLDAGREIWTHMKQLESLEIPVEPNNEKHQIPNLDSCFTGISKENCQRLHDAKVAIQMLQKCGLRVTDVETQLKELISGSRREHPSILDMTELKKLVIYINPRAKEQTEEGKKSIQNQTFSWISEELAFKLMPNLKVSQK